MGQCGGCSGGGKCGGGDSQGPPRRGSFGSDPKAVVYGSTLRPTMQPDDDGAPRPTSGFRAGMNVRCIHTGERGVVERTSFSLVWVKLANGKCVGWRPVDLEAVAEEPANDPR